jgi:NAD(P)-dependent dehydrogenase (short-subunit alcohol dehydrogenase family)
MARTVGSTAEGDRMRDFSGKTAFVTGGASGIGLALATALLDAGAKVMLADIEAEPLDRAVARLRTITPNVAGVVCDVADRAAVESAASETFRQFGDVQILCNNAGVSRAGRVEQISETDWQWVIGANLMGLVHGIQAFVPAMRASGKEGHIINTASMSGMRGGALSGPYVATKFAIVGLTEVLAAELADTTIGITVLCPAQIRTRMPENGRTRPARFGGPFELANDTENAERNARYIALNENGLDPDLFAAMVLDAVRHDELYVFSDTTPRAAIEERFEQILAAFGATEERTLAIGATPARGATRA